MHSEISPVIPLEESDPWLASEFLLIANGIHPNIRAIWIGKKTCAEVGHKGKLLILLKTNKLIAR